MNTPHRPTEAEFRSTVPFSRSGMRLFNGLGCCVSLLNRSHVIPKSDVELITVIGTARHRCLVVLEPGRRVQEQKARDCERHATYRQSRVEKWIACDQKPSVCGQLRQHSSTSSGASSAYLHEGNERFAECRRQGAQFDCLLSWHFACSNKRKEPKLRNGKVGLATWPFDSFLSRHFAYSNERNKPKLRNGKVRLRTWPFASFL